MTLFKHKGKIKYKQITSHLLVNETNQTICYYLYSFYFD